MDSQIFSQSIGSLSLFKRSLSTALPTALPRSTLPAIVAKGEPYLELLFELVGVAHPVGVAAPKGWLTGKRMKGCMTEVVRGYLGEYHMECTMI